MFHHFATIFVELLSYRKEIEQPNRKGRYSMEPPLVRSQLNVERF